MIYVFNIHIFIWNQFPVLSFSCTHDGLPVCLCTARRKCQKYVHIYFLDILYEVKVIAYLWRWIFYGHICELEINPFVSLLTCALSRNTCTGAGIGPKPVSNSDTTRRRITPCFFADHSAFSHWTNFNLFLAKFYGFQNWESEKAEEPTMCTFHRIPMGAMCLC